MVAKRGHLRYKTRKDLGLSKIKYFEKSSVQNAMRKRANGENYTTQNYINYIIVRILLYYI